MMRLGVAVAVVASCAPAPAPTTSPSWQVAIPDAHISELGAVLTPDRIVLGLEGRFGANVAGERRIEVIDHAGTQLSAPLVVDDVAVEARAFRPLAVTEPRLLALRNRALVLYDPPAEPAITSGSILRYAAAALADAYVVAAYRSTDVLVAVRLSFDGTIEREVTVSAISANIEVTALALVPTAGGVILVAGGPDVYAIPLTAAGDPAPSASLVATLPDDVTRIVHTSAGDTDVVLLQMDSELAIGALDPSLAWTPLAAISTGARVESVDVSAVASATHLTLVVQSDAMTAVPLLVRHDVELATGSVSPGALLTDGRERYANPELGRAADGTLTLLARRYVPGRAELVMTSLDP